MYLGGNVVETRWLRLLYLTGILQGTGLGLSLVANSQHKQRDTVKRG
jgi:hypothetical protein